MTTNLELRDVAAGYSEVIVRDISFVASPREVLAIVGVNGAGKSTILKAVVGGSTVHSGHVFLNGEEVTGRPGDQLAKQGIGYVPQSNDVFAGLTVIENLKMGGFLLKKREVQGRIDEMIDRFPQLAPKRSTNADKLSGGERKQLAIARALMAAPTVLLLDEPTSNLSPNVAESLLFTWVRELADEGRCIVVVEQRVEMVLEAADRACLIGSGAMQLVAPADEILQIVRTQGLLGEEVESGEAKVDTW